MKPSRLSSIALVAILSGAAFAADPDRQADVAARGPDVKPFSRAATTHVLRKLCSAENSASLRRFRRTPLKCN